VAREKPQKYGKTAKKPRDGVVAKLSILHNERQVRYDDKILHNQIETDGRTRTIVVAARRRDAVRVELGIGA